MLLKYGKPVPRSTRPFLLSYFRGMVYPRWWRNNMAAILIVDDEPGIRQMLARVLQAAGYEVGTASNGEEAIARLKEKTYALAILDVVMPGKGGVETFLEIRGTFKDLKVIIVSGKIDLSSSTFRGFAGHFGVARVVQKPYEPETILREVRSLLGDGGA
jgi:DNA-binding response OmpR family regulator